MIIPQNKKKKICLVSPKAYSLFNQVCKVPYGSAEVQIYLLSKEFSEKSDYEIHFITGDYNLKRSQFISHIYFLIENKKY